MANSARIILAATHWLRQAVLISGQLHAVYIAPHHKLLGRLKPPPGFLAFTWPSTSRSWIHDPQMAKETTVRRQARPRALEGVRVESRIIPQFAGTLPWAPVPGRTGLVGLDYCWSRSMVRPESPQLRNCSKHHLAVDRRLAMILHATPGGINP